MTKHNFLNLLREIEKHEQAGNDANELGKRYRADGWTDNGQPRVYALVARRRAGVCERSCQGHRQEAMRLRTKAARLWVSLCERQVITDVRELPTELQPIVSTLNYPKKC